MPATSQKQQRFFGWLKSNPAAAQARGIKPSVVDEFAHAPGGTTAGLPRQAGWAGHYGAQAGHSYDPGGALQQTGARMRDKMMSYEEERDGGRKPILRGQSFSPTPEASAGRVEGYQPQSNNWQSAPDHLAAQRRGPGISPLMMQMIQHVIMMHQMRNPQMGARDPGESYDFLRLVL